MIQWMKLEAVINTSDYELPGKWSIRKRIFIWFAGFMTFLLIEHGLAMGNSFHKTNIEIIYCNQTHRDRVELILTDQFGIILKNLPFTYNHFLGAVLEFLNFSYTLYWNFLSLFIMLISIGIAFLYEKIGSRVKKLQGSQTNDAVWAEIRTHHVKVSELLKTINNKIAVMLLLTCLNDGYFILSQIMNITTWV